MNDPIQLNPKLPEVNATKKTIHLTTFLGGICLLATAALASVNAWTAPIIAQREEDTRQAGYLALLDLESSSGYNIDQTEAISSSLSTVGVTKMTIFYEENTVNVFGLIYDVSTTGWEAGLNFQVGFKAGLYSGFNNVSNGETPNIGRIFINDFDAILTGLSADDISVVNDAVNAYLTSRTLSLTFANVTREVIVDALEVMAQDYLGRIAS
jgi:Na+-translocating ferredoxin:NAD+ oxidoreductase RnfG subunit